MQNRHAEAASMAAIAVHLGVPTRELQLEKRARTTWENVGCSAPIVRSADRVLVVSDSLHARRAVRYACRQGLELCRQYVAAGTRPPLDLFWWKVPAAAYELGIRIRDYLFYEQGSSENAPPCASHRTLL